MSTLMDYYYSGIKFNYAAYVKFPMAYSETVLFNLLIDVTRVLYGKDIYLPLHIFMMLIAAAFEKKDETFENESKIAAIEMKIEDISTSHEILIKELTDDVFSTKISEFKRKKFVSKTENSEYQKVKDQLKQLFFDKTIRADTCEAYEFFLDKFVDYLEKPHHIFHTIYSIILMIQEVLLTKYYRNLYEIGRGGEVKTKFDLNFISTQIFNKINSLDMTDSDDNILEMSALTQDTLNASSSSTRNSLMEEKKALLLEISQNVISEINNYDKILKNSLLQNSNYNTENHTDTEINEYVKAAKKRKDLNEDLLKGSVMKKFSKGILNVKILQLIKTCYANYIDKLKNENTNESINESFNEIDYKNLLKTPSTTGSLDESQLDPYRTKTNSDSELSSKKGGETFNFSSIKELDFDSSNLQNSNDNLVYKTPVKSSDPFNTSKQYPISPYSANENSFIIPIAQESTTALEQNGLEFEIEFFNLIEYVTNNIELPNDFVANKLKSQYLCEKNLEMFTFQYSKLFEVYEFKKFANLHATAFLTLEKLKDAIDWFIQYQSGEVSPYTMIQYMMTNLTNEQIDKILYCLFTMFDSVVDFVAGNDKNSSVMSMFQCVAILDDKNNTKGYNIYNLSFILEFERDVYVLLGNDNNNLDVTLDIENLSILAENDINTSIMESLNKSNLNLSISLLYINNLLDEKTKGLINTLYESKVSKEGYPIVTTLNDIIHYDVPSTYIIREAEDYLYNITMTEKSTHVIMDVSDYDFSVEDRPFKEYFEKYEEFDNMGISKLEYDALNRLFKLFCLFSRYDIKNLLQFAIPINTSSTAILNSSTKKIARLKNIVNSSVNLSTTSLNDVISDSSLLINSQDQNQKENETTQNP